MFNHKLHQKSGNISEFTFSIPFYIEENGKPIKNKHVNLIKERMLVLVQLGTEREWFIIDSIEESGDDSDIFNVNAFSLAYELSRKRVHNLVVEVGNAEEILDKILERLNWKKGFIDDQFKAMARNFDSGEDSNGLEAVMNWAETFGGLLDFDTDKKEISLKDVKKDGKFRGLTLKQNRLLNSISRNRTSDEMVTRLHVEGNEGLTIHGVNPTGQGYLEDFSFFIYPFERDADRNVIRSSDYMSDALCHALLDHKALIEKNAPQITPITKNIQIKTTELIAEQSNLIDLQGELDTILELLDMAKSVLSQLQSENPVPDLSTAQALVKQRENERDAKKVEVTAQENKIIRIEGELDTLSDQLQKLQDAIQKQADFTPDLLEELDYYIIESTWREDRIVSETELYEEALIKFSELREPKVAVEATMDSIYNNVEEQYYWDKIVLGDLAKVDYVPMAIEYMAKIIEMEFDFENEDVTLTIANTKDILSDSEKLTQLIYGSSYATSLVENNKYKWDRINAISKDVSSLLSSEWDANKQKIIAGVNNSIEVGKRGIIITNPDVPDEMVIMQAGIIALSKDGGETWQTAVKPDGIVAERLIGKLIAGEEMVITNSSGTFIMDNNGLKISADSIEIYSNGRNLIHGWEETTNLYKDFQSDGMLTAYEKKMVKYDMERITSEYNENMEKARNFYSDITQYSFVVNYQNAYRELYDYLFVIPQGAMPILDPNNMANTTRIDKAYYDQKFRAYYDSSANLRTEYDLFLKNLSVIAKDLAEQAQDNIDELANDIVYKIELISTNGLSFKNNIINTQIIAHLYRGNENITSQLPQSSFIWKKINKDGNLDTAWNNAHKNVGNTITVTGADIYARATFQCEINIEL